MLPRRFWGQNLPDPGAPADSSITGPLSFPSSFSFREGIGGRASDRNNAEFDPEELVDRADLASAIRRAGEPELAAAELGKILILDPNHIGARMTRATQAVEAHQFDEAIPDIEAVIDDPRLLEYLREERLLLRHFHESNHPSLISVLQTVSRHYCATGRIQDGKRIARHALDLAIALEQPTGESRYTLARAYVASGQQLRRASVREVAKHLYHAFVAHPLYKERYAGDPAFNVARAQVDQLLGEKPDSGDVYRRGKLAAMALPKGR